MTANTILSDEELMPIWAEYKARSKTGMWLMCSVEQAVLAKLKDQLEDAARYRWLRHGDNDDLVLQRGPLAEDFWYLPRNEKLDEMIDARRRIEGVDHA